MKTITLEYGGNTYKLEFTRRSVETLENQGFDISELKSKLATTIPKLFAGAFLANHPYVRKGIIDEIYGQTPNKEDLLGKLAEMYSDVLEALLAEPETKEGNATWGANW